MSLIEISDLLCLKTISTPVYQPQGDSVLYVENGIVEKTQEYYSSIYLYNSLEKTKECLIHGGKNTSPLWNREGSSFLFLSDETGKNQAYLYTLATGEIKQVSAEKQGLQQIIWHPDNLHFFYSTTRKNENSSEVFITEKIDYISNGQGLLDDEQKNVICQGKLDNFETEEITACSLGYGLHKIMTVSNDGQYLFYERLLLEDSFNQDSGLFRMNLGTKSEDWLSASAKKGMFGEAAISEGGRYVGTIGTPISYHTSNQLGLSVIDLRTQQMTSLSKKLDVQVSDFAVSDCKPTTSNSLLQWSNPLKAFFTLISIEGKVSLYCFSLEGDFESYPEVGPHVYDFTLHPTKPKALLCCSAPDSPSQLLVLDLETRKITKWLNPNQSFEEEKQFAVYQKIEAKANDGGRIPGYLVRPLEKTKQVGAPLIVNIHGGPYTMHGETFHHEIQQMVAAGYFVLLLNPRGSFGYGQDHLKGVVGKYGEEDYSDIMTALDHVLAKEPEIDENRLFVTGGSYGGFMVNWIVTQTNRFKAAITQRSMSNFVSMIGTSDIGYYFFVEENAADIIKPAKLWEKSPLAYVGQVETPVLVMHGEEDYRCPMEQAEQWYRALKYQKKEAKFIRFPNSNHELSRTGKPAFRLIRLKEMMDWFKQHDDITN